MRLLHTEDSRFETFIGQKPEFAILSHTWGENEVSYQTMLETLTQLRTGVRPYSDLPLGLQKVQECRLKAKENGFDWVWIDTCCIDKYS